jgi:hypothetical protein
LGSLAWSGSRAGGNVRGERARPEFLLEGAKAEVQGRRVRVRRANPRGIAGVGRGESGADEAIPGSGSQGKQAMECLPLARCLLFLDKLAKKRARTSR